MHPFSRVLRLALQHRLNILGLVGCALAVGVFWGGNISAVYPIVKVAFQGQSLQAWVDGEVAAAREKSRQLQQELAALDAREAEGNAEGPATPRRERDLLAARLRAEDTALATVERLQPLIHRTLPDDPFRTIVLIVAVLMVATVVKNLFLFADGMLLERLVQMVIFELRKQLYHHALKMDLSEFGEQRIGLFMSRFNVDLNTLRGGLVSLFGKAVSEPLKGLACLAGAAYICPRLLLLSLILTPLAAVLIRSLARSIKRANRRALEENAQLMGVLSEALSGMPTIKAFTMETYERGRFHKISKACVRKAMKIAFYNALARPATEILGMGVVFTALIAGAYLVLNEETHILGLRMCDRPLSIAALMCFYGLLIGASDPARKLSDVFNAIQGGVAAADRIYDVLDRRPRIVDPAAPKPAPRPHRQLVFHHVSFHYAPDRPVLQDIDFRIRRGETLCIVGPNGCGKTTLAHLLPRFHDPQAGAILLDETDLRDLRLRDLRRMVGMVTQRTLLFDDTVLHNIRYGSPGATREQVVEAARKAHADRFIEEKLEDGYETVVGPGGGRLSGGQRQRIALARAILRDPEILVLDEATSQIDLESEQLIHQALEEFVQGRTAIIITHRLSTLELADRILVLESGRIADLGSHDELIRRCNLYLRLHNLQFRQSA